MIIRYIEISEEIADKIEGKHGIKIEEVKEAIINKKYIVRVGGKQYKILGRTNAGRCLAVFFKYFKETAEVTTARGADESEKRRC